MLDDVKEGGKKSENSTKAEYMEIAEAGKDMIWMTDYLEELGKKQHENILYTNS